MGKTALAVQAGHRVAPHFPDGRFYLDLHAHTVGQTPVDPATALATLLRARGRAADTIPLDPGERVAAWRAETAGLRVLLVIDNAVGADQVRPLLPGSGGSMVLVTSRRRLTSLEGARSLPLGLLPMADATLLFRQVLGDRADNRQDAVEEIEEIAELCGRLPLAIRIAAARLRHRPSWPITALAGRLRDERRRLGELATSDLAVSAAFQTSFSHVGEQERRVFALLGLVPGPDIDARAAAALTELPADAADRSLEELLDIHLVEQVTVDRYTLHDLLRIHCAAQAAELPEPERRQALRLLLDHYRYRASLAMDAVFPLERNRRPEVKPAEADALSITFADSAAAAEWLDAERTALISASSLADFPQHIIDLSAILARYLELGAHGSQGRLLHERALESARAVRDPLAEAGALRYLGLTHLQNADFTAALAVLRESLTVLQKTDQQRLLPSTLNNLGAVYGRLGRLEQSADHFEQALRVAREQDDIPNETRAINNLGLARRRQGRLDEALLLHHDSLDLARRHGDALLQSIALDNLGVLHRLLGRLDEALSRHREALVLDREANDHAGEAVTIDNLGLVHLRMGDHAAALEHFQQALALGRQLDSASTQAIALGNIGSVLRAQGDLDAALRHHRQALELFRESDDALNLAEALNNLGETLLATGSAPEALALHRRALELVESCGDPIETARTRDLLGHAHHAVGDHPAARHEHTLALQAYRRMGLPQGAAAIHTC
ncbi:tetratricopeptide repeat protein [Streptacidiphilus sp. 4-A2]|nr:tetratricopeptide repeat protein [Streptacidiphilus sp. 4-A2]